MARVTIVGPTAVATLDSILLTAQVVDDKGNEVNGPAVQWVSSDSLALALTNAGYAVGVAGPASVTVSATVGNVTAQHAVSVSLSPPIEIGALPDGPPVYPSVVVTADAGPVGINSHDEIAGNGLLRPNEGQGISPEQRAFYWSPQMGMREIASLGGIWTDVVGITNSGIVGGSSALTPALGGARHIITWSVASGTRDVGAPPGHSDCQAIAVNNKVQIVGVCEQRTSFVWDSVDGFRDLGSMVGHARFFPTSIADDGVIVGVDSAGLTPAIWSPVGGYEPIAPLPGPNMTPVQVVSGERVLLTGASSRILSAGVWTQSVGYLDAGLHVSQGDMWNHPKFVMNAAGQIAVSPWGAVSFSLISNPSVFSNGNLIELPTDNGQPQPFSYAGSTVTAINARGRGAGYIVAGRGADVAASVGLLVLYPPVR